MPERSAPPRDLLTEAEGWAAANIDAAVRIRAEGGVPRLPGFTPPPPEIVSMLVTGQSPILCAIGSLAREASATPALVSPAAALSRPATL